MTIVIIRSPQRGIVYYNEYCHDKKHQNPILSITRPLHELETPQAFELRCKPLALDAVVRPLFAAASSGYLELVELLGRSETST